MIQGKGYYVWRVEKVLARIGTNDPKEAVDLAIKAGIEHVLIKIADGDEPFPLPEKDPNGRLEQLTQAFIQACKAGGLTVWGWAFAYGPPQNPTTQADLFAERARRFGLSGLVINAENIGNNIWSSAKGRVAAKEYVTRLRQGLKDFPELLIGLSSYRYLKYHPEFPFTEFMEGCDVAMPQVYWVDRGAGDAVRNLRRTYQEYKDAFPHKLFVPTGAAYGEGYQDGKGRYFWSSSPEQLERFLDQARIMGLPAVNFWSWEHALNDPLNEQYNQTELWDTIARYRFKEKDGQIAVPAEPIAKPLQISIGDQGYYDGVYPQYANAVLTPFSWYGQTMKYGMTVSDTPSSIWAAWRPDVTESGLYDIQVWVPGRNGTTRRAHYQIHGVVGEFRPLTVVVNQNRFFDEWVSLGIFNLDANNPMSGQVNLTNSTNESGRKISFTTIRWQAVNRMQEETTVLLADGFDAPIGTPAERAAVKMWPGKWSDANPFGNFYRLRGSIYAYHTGADLNLNQPGWDSDRGMPVYAIGSGEVTAAVWLQNWGNVVIVRHDPLVPNGRVYYSRYGHLGRMNVHKGQRVRRGQVIGLVGQDANKGPFHLHFDISKTEVLFESPGDWPGLNRQRLRQNYIDPKRFIIDNRPLRKG